MEHFAEFDDAFRGDWDEILATVQRLEWLDLATSIRFEEMISDSPESQSGETQAESRIMQRFGEFADTFRGDWDEILATVQRLEWLDLATSIRFEEMISDSLESQSGETQAESRSSNNEDTYGDLELEVSVLDPEWDLDIPTNIQSEECLKETFLEPEPVLLESELYIELDLELKEFEVKTEPAPESQEPKISKEPEPEETDIAQEPEPELELEESVIGNETVPEPEEVVTKTETTKPKSEPFEGWFRRFWRGTKKCFLCCIPPKRKHRKSAAKNT